MSCLTASTFRAWTMGLFCAVLFPGVNEFMSLRWPAVSVSNVSPTLCCQAVELTLDVARRCPPGLSCREAMGQGGPM